MEAEVLNIKPGFSVWVENNQVEGCTYR